MRSPDRGFIVTLSAAGLLTATALAMAWTMTDDGAAAAAATDRAIVVRDAAQLARTIANARDGTRITLAPGEYGRLVIRGRQFAQPIIIQGPAGPARARFDVVRVVDSRGVRLDGIEVAMPQPAADGAYVRIQGSQSITLANAYVHGSLDGDPRNDGLGVHLADSTDVTVSGGDLEQLQVGVMIKGVQGARVIGNRIHGIRTDGVISAAAETLEISGNYITDFTPNPADHADGIQLHNRGVDRGTTSVVIADNVIMQGKGAGVQGIWISDGDVFPHRDLTITNNLVYINGMYNGIGLNHVQGARVTNNTVVSDPGDAMQAWIRVQNSSGVVLERNISDKLLLQKNITGLVRRDNMFFTGRATPKCLFPKLNAGAAAMAGDFAVAELGFQPGPKVHPTARASTGAVPAGGRAAQRCAGQTES